MHPMAANNGKYHDTVKNTNAQFHWGIADGKDLEFLSKVSKKTPASKAGDELRPPA